MLSSLVDICGQLLSLDVVIEIQRCRSSRPEVICKNGVLRNFIKFTGKHLCQRLFFNEVAGLGAFFKKKKRDSGTHRCFPVNFVKFLRTPFYIEHLGWLLLAMNSRTQHCNIVFLRQCNLDSTIGNN